MLHEILPAGIITVCCMLKYDSGELADCRGVGLGPLVELLRREDRKVQSIAT